MNIFTFDKSPYLSALWLDDVRKNKMILETAQLLSSAVRYNGYPTEYPVYKMTHKGHPCTKWTRESRANFDWLLNYFIQLCDMKPGHKSSGLLEHFTNYLEKGRFPSDKRTPFVNCAANQSQGLNFKAVTDTHLAYRKYYSERLKRDTIRLSWKYGTKPDWLDTL